MERVKVNFIKLDKNAYVPTYGTPSSAGADLYAVEECEIGAGKTVMVHTGIAMEIPEGFGGFVFARSGMACKRGLAPANKVGVIDSDYRGELMIALHNHGTEPQTVSDGERVAQLILLPVLTPVYLEADALDETERGTGGFGSTGK